MDIQERYSDFRDQLTELDDIYFIFLAILLAFGSLQTAGAVTDTQKPVVTVVSPSMCPDLQVGDILFVEGTDYENVQEGDIIVYDVPDRAELTIDGEKIILEKNTTEFSKKETSLGTLELLEVRPAADRDRDEVLLALNGSPLQPLEEGEEYNIEGRDVSVDYATDLPVGDIPIVHRVVRKNNRSLETLGDANSGQLEFEREVRPYQIHGKVFFKIPRLGLIKLYAMDLAGYAGDRPLAIDNTPSC